MNFIVENNSLSYTIAKESGKNAIINFMLKTQVVAMLLQEDIAYQYSTKGDKKFSSTVRYHQSYPHIFAYREVLPNPVDGMRERCHFHLKG